MANFNTHITVAAGASMVAASALFVTQITTPTQTIFLMVLGALAGILPDIDSDNSVALRWVFNSLATILSFAILFHSLQGHYSILIALLLFAITFFAIRVILLRVFAKFTRHRGVFHSLPMAGIFSLLTVLICHLVFGLPNLLAWLAGCFVLFGVLIHLLLDELYSVDLGGIELKKSFGTALTIIDRQHLLIYLILYIVAGAGFYLTPGYAQFSKTLLTRKNWQTIQNRFWPNNHSANTNRKKANA